MISHDTALDLHRAASCLAIYDIKILIRTYYQERINSSNRDKILKYASEHFMVDIVNIASSWTEETSYDSFREKISKIKRTRKMSSLLEEEQPRQAWWRRLFCCSQE